MKRTPLRRISKKRMADISSGQSPLIAKIAKRNDFFSKIWTKRPHRCESCGNPLGQEIRSYMFDHLLEKVKYPEYEFDEDNILLVCLECHTKKGLGFPTEKHEQAILNYKTSIMSENQVQAELSLGESRVRTKFNPASDGIVDQIKQKTAELIDLSNTLKDLYLNRNPHMSIIPGELIRVVSLAQTEYESAGHWAVKAATYGL